MPLPAMCSLIQLVRMLGRVLTHTSLIAHLNAVDPNGLALRDVVGTTPSGNAWGNVILGSDGRAHPVVSGNAPPCLRDCILAHERVHANEYNSLVPNLSNNPNMVVGQALSVDINTNEGSRYLASSELRAYRVSLGCLLKKIKESNCDDCASQWKAEADRVKGKIRVALAGRVDDFYFGEWP
jgi:hypothetical protein